MAMRVTVIVTNRNYADYINGCLDSIFKQDYPYKQIVVVDDGSEDDSQSVITARTNPGVCSCDCSIFLMDRGRGVSPSRNFAIQQTWDQTDLFMMLDADDEYKPDKIAETVKVIGSKVGLVYTDEEEIDLLNERRHVLYREPFSMERLAEENIIGGNFAVTRQALDQVGVFDEEMPIFEDYDLACRVTEKYVAVHIPKVLTMTRLTTRSIRNNILPDHMQFYKHRLFTKAIGRGKT